MVNSPNEDNGLSELETIRRRDDALKRALNTPPKPLHKRSAGKPKNGKLGPDDVIRTELRARADGGYDIVKRYRVKRGR